MRKLKYNGLIVIETSDMVMCEDGSYAEAYCTIVMNGCYEEYNVLFSYQGAYDETVINELLGIHGKTDEIGETTTIETLDRKGLLL